MYDIILVFTHHSELGKCNSDELYKIIESIKPDVIFDELPLAAFNMFYSDSFEIYQINKRLLTQIPPEVPLEIKCIKKYKQYYDVGVFPVDIDVSRRLAKYHDEIAFMSLTFFQNEEYQKLDNENDMLTRLEGFHYLNSDKFLEFLERKRAIEKDIIEAEIGKRRLFDIYHLFQAEQYDNRETAMLDNIYYYSKEIQYKQAVFLIGAGHKKSIMQKIASLEKLSEIKLNWTLYGNE
jgi:hypothetical protein